MKTQRRIDKEIKQTRIDAAIKNNGAFFAFNVDQFKEHATPSVTYISVGAGLRCPKGKVKQLTRDLKQAQRKIISDDLDVNTRKEIIHRELANHETQITCDIAATVNALKGYGITEAEIQREFGAYMDYCLEHDLF